MLVEVEACCRQSRRDIRQTLGAIEFWSRQRQRKLQKSGQSPWTWLLIRMEMEVAL